MSLLQPYQTQHRVVSIVKSEIALLFTRDT